MITQDDSPMRSELNGAVSDLVKLIRESSGFRFCFASSGGREGFIYNYHCSQDVSHEAASKSSGKRDRSRMVRYPCESKLVLHPNLETRQLSLTMFHHHHDEYADISLSHEIKHFVNKNLYLTPSELRHRIRQEEIPGRGTAATQQIYYHWQKANSSTWRLDADPIVSVSKLLSGDNLTNKFYTRVFHAGEIRAIAIYINDTINTLRSASELSIDATYGTNSSGMELYAVLAEFDGTGVPLCYMFVEKTPVSGTSASRPGDAGMTGIVHQFLVPVREPGLRPTFFGSDKDQCEIRSIATVWDNVKNQLCYWHALRALRMKLKSSKQTDHLSQYHPQECEGIIQDFESCWGSLAEKRSGPHLHQNCFCSSRGTRYERRGNVECKEKQHRKEVEDMFIRHFNAHSFIPNSHGAYQSSSTIYQQSCSEMFSYCRHHNFHHLWA